MKVFDIISTIFVVDVNRVVFVKNVCITIFVLLLIEYEDGK